MHYDLEADILYIVLREGPVEDTFEASDDVFIEVDGQSNVIGIEIWNASKNVSEHLSRVVASRVKRQPAAVTPAGRPEAVDTVGGDG